MIVEGDLRIAFPSTTGPCAEGYVSTYAVNVFEAAAFAERSGRTPA